MKAGHLLFFALSILILVGWPFCVAQSRSSDKELFQAIAKGDIGAVRVLLEMVPTWRQRMIGEIPR